MGFKKSLVSGIVAFVVATLAVRAVGGERFSTKIGVVTGLSVAVSTLLSGGEDDEAEQVAESVPAN
ncbi:hypothetical protein [Halorussus amylolyticus]|uniref:hypothetical protein n=1 Tax=Halorussus amylolyticus TaxID=1126242 RepID=UPI0010477F63|nr:hypothetical protein [Halorussus amylolyticus]